MACSDGRNLSFYDRLDSMDIASILMVPYQAGQIPLPVTARNHDPGRLRAEPLLKNAFGQDERGVRARLVPVRFLGQTVLFQRQLGAAAALSRVSQELMAEIPRDSSLSTFLSPFTSAQVDLRQYVFSWRFVAGTQRLSTHSFGTAIDLLRNDGPQYWLWDERVARPELARQGEAAYRDIHFIPRGAPRMHAKVLAAFEKNGFIWGGKWNHYDTMHFEYRPEFFPGLNIDCAQHAELDDSVVNVMPASLLETPHDADH
jgi:hypothetical protein